MVRSDRPHGRCVGALRRDSRRSGFGIPVDGAGDGDRSAERADSFAQFLRAQRRRVPRLSAGGDRRCTTAFRRSRVAGQHRDAQAHNEPRGIIALATAIGIGNDPRMSQTAGCVTSLGNVCNVTMGSFSTGPPARLIRSVRLAGNLNFRLPRFEGETWMAATTGKCVQARVGVQQRAPARRGPRCLIRHGIVGIRSRRSVRSGRSLYHGRRDRPGEWQLIANVSRFARVKAVVVVG